MTHRIVVANAHANPIEFWLEPWGDGVTVRSRQAVTLGFCGPSEVELRLDVSHDRIIVWVEAGDLCHEGGRLFDVEASDQQISG